MRFFWSISVDVSITDPHWMEDTPASLDNFCKSVLTVRPIEHTVVELLQSSDNDYLMNETRRKPTTGIQFPILLDKWHSIFYNASRTDTAGHTMAYYPVGATGEKIEVASPANRT